MNSEKMLSKNFVRSVQLIHFALMAGVVIFTIIAYLLVSNGFNAEGLEETDSLFLIIVPVFVTASLLGGNFLFKLKLKEAKNQVGLREKLNFYRGVLIIRLAMLEGPSFFSIVIYLVAGNLIFLGIAVFLILVFVVFKPTKDKIIADLELDHVERQIIENPDGVIN